MKTIRFLSFLFALFLVLVCNAQVEYRTNGIAYWIYDSYAKVGLFDTQKPTVPQTVTYKNKTYFVTAIKYDAANDTYKDYNVVTVNFANPSAVSVIEYRAFNNCSNLSYINLPSSVSKIEGSAFYGCSRLESIGLPKNSKYTTILKHTLLYCNSIQSITIPEQITTIEEEAFYCSKLTNITCNPLVPPTAYENSFTAGIETLNVNESAFDAYRTTAPWSGAKTIAAEGTSEIKLLTGGINYLLDKSAKTATIVANNYSGDVAIPDAVIYKDVTYTVTALSRDCFDASSSLSSITLPSSVTGVEPSTLPATAQVYVPGETYEIYTKTEGWKDAVLNIIGETDKQVKLVLGGLKYQFWKQKKTATLLPFDYKGAIEIPEMAVYKNAYYSVDSIQSECFKGATLESVNIPYTVTTIGTDAFKDSKLDTYIYNGDLDSWCNIKFANEASNPASVVGKLIFNGEEITDIELSDNITHVPDFAFYNITGAQTATLGENITSLGEKSFYGCGGLTSFTCTTAAPPTVGTEALPTKLAKLVVPCNAYGTYYANSDWNFATNIVSSKDDDEKAEFVTDGVLYQLDKAKNTVAVEANNYTGNVVIPANIDYNKASYPVTDIAADAFKGSNGASVTIPASVTAIGADAFADATNLTYNFTGTVADWCGITFANLNANPVYISGKLVINGEELKEATLPGTLSALQANVFAGCKELTTLTSLNTTPPTVAGDFSNTSITTLYVPITAIDQYKSTEPWSSIENILPLDAEVKSVASLKDGSVIQIYPYGHAGETTLSLSAVTANKQLTSTEKASGDGNSWTLENDGDGAYYIKNGLGLYWAYQQSNVVYKPMTLVDDKAKAVAVTPVWNDAFSGIAFRNAKDNTYLCNIYTYNYRYNWYKASAPLTDNSNYTFVVYLTGQAEAATGIGGVMADGETNDAWYTIYGVRIDKPSHRGVYIHNGKKVIVR